MKTCIRVHAAAQYNVPNSRSVFVVLGLSAENRCSDRGM